MLKKKMPKITCFSLSLIFFFLKMLLVLFIFTLRSKVQIVFSPVGMYVVIRPEARL